VPGTHKVLRMHSLASIRARFVRKVPSDGLQRLTKAEWKDSGGSVLYGYQYNYDNVFRLRPGPRKLGRDPLDEPPLMPLSEALPGQV